MCPELTNPINGVVVISSYFVGDIAKYECDEGFGLAGPGTRICLSDGRWSILSSRCDRELLISTGYELHRMRYFCAESAECSALIFLLTK